MTRGTRQVMFTRDLVANSPPQLGCGQMFRLSQKSSKRAQCRPLVKMSANCLDEGTCKTLTSPSETLSRTK
jgi:hypothetical protein